MVRSVLWKYFSGPSFSHLNTWTKYGQYHNMKTEYLCFSSTMLTFSGNILKLIWWRKNGKKLATRDEKGRFV